MSENPITRVHIVDYERDGTSEKSCGKCSFLRCSSLNRSMDVFSMIKHSIISDEANPITKYFDIRQHVGSCGPDMIWKIHHAYRIEDNKVLNEILPLMPLCQIFSSPEPYGSQGELIVYPLFGVPLSVIHQSTFPKIFSETAWPVKAKFYMKYL